jgi:hypothetical protein
MPTLTQEDVCTFDELSDSAKETARDWMRDCEIEDFGQDTESLYYSALAAAKILGIDFDDKGKRSEPDIRWSGFSSQGDGASFVGSYSHSPNSPARIRSEFPTDTALHAIADGLDAIQNGFRLLTGHRINARITQEGCCVHNMTMSVTVEDVETGDELEDVEPEEKILDLMRDFADWIYKGLEAEYDYRLSDENIDERIGDGEYQFDAETGEVV